MKQVKAQQAQVTLVAPIWKGQPWYPVLLEMLWNFPWWIFLSNDLFLMTSESVVMNFQPQLCHMAYLQEMFAGQNLSNTARDLLLASWQTKSNKTYKSHFKKWLC